MDHSLVAEDWYDAFVTTKYGDELFVKRCRNFFEDALGEDFGRAGHLVCLILPVKLCTVTEEPGLGLDRHHVP